MESERVRALAALWRAEAALLDIQAMQRREAANNIESYLASLEPESHDEATATTVQSVKPEKLKAPTGMVYRTTQVWRNHIYLLKDDLRIQFGNTYFTAQMLRDFIEEKVDLLPGDLEPYGHGKRAKPKWHTLLCGAINEGNDRNWPSGVAIIFPTETRNCYLLTRSPAPTHP